MGSKTNRYTVPHLALVIFSMFFGAGNITFPLLIGQCTSGIDLILAMLGLFITAICIPFSGLIATLLFQGNYHTFFNRMGKHFSNLIITLLIALIGPFGGMARCISLPFATLKFYIPSLSLLYFSILSSSMLFLICQKRGNVLNLIGYVLSPLLLGLLIIIMVKGICTPSTVITPTIKHPFLYGLKEGYNTMDLLATFFFASLVYQRGKNMTKEETPLLKPVIYATGVAALLLNCIYLGFSYTASNLQPALVGITIDKILIKICSICLGDWAGILVSIAITLTCLTTAVALAVICAEFTQKIFKQKIKYRTALGIILVINTLVSLLSFTGIVNLLLPILQLLYPALFVLSCCNILHKTCGLTWIKLPVYLTILGTLYWHYFT